MTDFNQKLANWENALLNAYLDRPDAPECNECGSTDLHEAHGEVECGECGFTQDTEEDYEPDPDRFRDDPDYAPYYGD